MSGGKRKVRFKVCFSSWTCVTALQSMLALPISRCFLSTIQNLLWRTPCVRRPKSTFLTWTPVDGEIQGSDGDKIEIKPTNRYSSKPFSSKIFRSVEFGATEGTLVITLTEMFLEGSSPSSLRTSFPWESRTNRTNHFIYIHHHKREYHNH